MSDTVSDTVSVSDTMSDTMSDISNEFQQDLQEALIQCQSIERIHDDILDRLNHLRENIADTIYIVRDGQERDFNNILDELYQEALEQVETTGHHPFGRMLLATLANAEFKYSTSTI
jgi:hypothetical protein